MAADPNNLPTPPKLDTPDGGLTDAAKRDIRQAVKDGMAEWANDASGATSGGGGGDVSEAFVEQVRQAMKKIGGAPLG